MSDIKPYREVGYRVDGLIRVKGNRLTDDGGEKDKHSRKVGLSKNDNFICQCFSLDKSTKTVLKY